LEWSTNEKVALENALAAAWCGLRAICTMKHVGLNVAADPLMTSAYTGVTGGLVILSADDPFAHSSQNEQDTRRYAHFARLPCLDPSSIQEAHDMARDAFALSEEFGLPVILRPTTRICHSKGDVNLGEVGTEHRTATFHRNPQQYVVIPAHTRPLHKALNAKQPAIRQRLSELGYNRCTVRGRTAVITGGVSAAYVQEVLGDDVSLAIIGAYPIDEDWLREFVDQHNSVLVVEELDPVIEEVVRRSAAPGACTARRFMRCAGSFATAYSQATLGVTPWASSSAPWTQPYVWEPRSPSGAGSPAPGRSARSSAP
jgi:indolepyruvate ferredoxin oxidoreductase alpha subunit